MVVKVSPIPTSVPNDITGLQRYLRDMAGKVNTYLERVAAADPFFIKDLGCTTPPTNEVEANALEIVFVSPYAGAGTIVLTGVGFSSGNLNLSLNGASLGTISDPDIVSEVLYEIAADDLIQGFNSLKLWSTDSDTGEIRSIEVWRNFVRGQVTAAGETAIWGSVTGAGKPADNAQVNAPTLGLLVNSDYNGNANPGELSLVGFDSDGNLAPGTDGYFWFADVKYTVDGGAVGGGTVVTNVANRKGFIVYDTANDTFSWIGGGFSNIQTAFCFRSGGVWFFDNNGAGVAFTPTANHIALGWIETGVAPDSITRAALYTPVPLLSAVFPGATVGASLGEDFFRSDGSTSILESEIVAAFNKIASSNASNFVEDQAIGTSLIKDLAVVRAKIGVGAVGSLEVENGSINDAHINNLTVDKITTGDLNSQINVNSGFITFDNGTVLRVMGTGFGSNNQFIEWYGMKPNPFTGFAQLTEANATQYLKTDGSAFFGGDLSAGTLTTSAQTSLLSSTASVETGTFGSNGNPIDIIGSYSLLGTQTTGTFSSFDVVSDNTVAFGSVDLYVDEWTGSAWVQRTSLLGIGGTQRTRQSDNGEGVTGTRVDWSVGGSVTYTDNTGTTANRLYRARIENGDHALVTNPSQRVSITATEE